MTASLRIGIFAAACLAQLLAVGGGILRHERALGSGTAYRFELAPVDPYDPFRGRYVALAFDVERSRVPAPPGAEPGDLLYVVLENDANGFARIRALRVERPTEGDVVRARYEASYEGVTQLDLPFDRFYAEESEARRLERELARREPTSRSYAIVRVLDGHGVIESLVVNEKPSSH